MRHSSGLFVRSHARRCRWACLFAPLAALLCLPAAADNHALLVGINAYQHVRPLKGAVNDIVRFQEVLERDLNFLPRNIRVLTNEQATRENILAALDALASDTRAGDTVFWYYSGHGWVQTDVDGDEREFDPDDTLDETLVPYDAVPWPRERALEPNPTMIVDDEIGERLSRLAGRRLVVVFDSCHSGTATRSLGEEDTTRSLYENYALPATPRTRSLKRGHEMMDMDGQAVFLSAASPTQAASDLGEFEGQRHGAFSASLLRAIHRAGPGWSRTRAWDDLFREAREDLVNQGFASQTPSIAATRGLAKVPVEQFLNPPPAAEIALLQAGAFGLELSVNRDRFEDGDVLELAVASERDGHLYVFDINAEQAVTQLFPNRFAPENRVTAGTQLRLPAPDAGYRFRAGQPYGRSTIVAVVSRTPWAELQRLELPANFQPISDSQAGGLRDSLRALLDAALAANTGQERGNAEWSSRRAVVEISPKSALAEATPAEAPPGAVTAAPGAAASVPPAASSVSAPPAADLAPAALAVPAAVSPAAVSMVAARPPEPLASAPGDLPSPAVKIDFPGAVVDEDKDLPPEVQADLRRARPKLFAKLEQLAERFSPIFWQDVSGDFDKQFRPWRDFFVRFDFDQTDEGPNWPTPPNFQDENKRTRNGLLDSLLTPAPGRRILPSRETPGIYRIVDGGSSSVFQLDLRPYVYWTVLSTDTHYFFHYVVFHAEDWKSLFGHTGDLEGTTIVVDRKTERMVAAFTLAHDDVGVVRSLDDEPEGNIGVLVDPAAESRDLYDGEDGRPVDGSLAMEAGRDGAPAPKEHQDVYVETKGHGHYGPHKIKPARYIVYANFLPEETFAAPSFDRNAYPLTNRFGEVVGKHKYRLVYIGSGAGGTRSAEDKSLWGEYKDLTRFRGGANPPWEWRDNLFFRTGWWKDPRRIKKIGAAAYRINPYLPGKN